MDSGDTRDIYCHACKDAMKKILRDLSCTSEEIKIFLSRVKVKVKQAEYEGGNDEWGSVSAAAEIRSLAGSEDVTMRISLEFYHRVGWSTISHFSKVDCSLSGAAIPVFSTEMMDTDQYGFSDSAPNIELRKFKLKPRALNLLHSVIFQGFKAELTPYVALQLILATVGVSGIENLVVWPEWLGYHSRVLCGCTNEGDEGYETHDPMERLKEALVFYKEGLQDESDLDEDNENDFF